MYCLYIVRWDIVHDFNITLERYYVLCKLREPSEVFSVSDWKTLSHATLLQKSLLHYNLLLQKALSSQINLTLISG